MTAEIRGIDRYSGSWRKITLGLEGALVAITVQGSDGDGEALLTPDQARALGAGLHSQAEFAVRASEMTGEFDVPG